MLSSYAPYVYLVVKCVPDIYEDIERCFHNEENAHNYIAENFPFVYYHTGDQYSKGEPFYAMDNLSPEQLEVEERYFVLQKEMH